MARNALDRQRKRQAAAKLAAGSAWQDRDGLIFTDAVGRPLLPEYVSHAFADARKAAGLPTATLHQLGAADWVAAVVAGLSGLIGTMLEFFLDDDPVAAFGYTWDAGTLHEVLDKNGGAYDVVSEGGSSSRGRYRLRTRVTRMV